MDADLLPSDPLAAERVLDLLRDLIRRPSVNPALTPRGGAGESSIARFARDWLVERGVEAWIEEAAPDRPNVVARVGAGKGPVLVVCAHLDTVGVAGMEIEPFEPTVRHGRVFGRGSYDMKGGVAAALSAAAVLAREGLPGTLLLALVADEEYASAGARHFVANHAADACILTEPSEHRLILGHKGFVWIEIAASGRAAHGSRWDLGVSAIGKIGRVVAALERFDTDILRSRVHPLLGPASMHCAMISGGSGLSTYADRCTVQVERRTLPGETAAGVLAEIDAIVSAVGETATTRVLLERPPSSARPTRALRRACGTPSLR